MLGTRRSSWGRPSEWIKWTNEIGAFHHQTDIFDIGPVWIFAPTACPRTGSILTQSRTLYVLGTRTSFWGRPSEWWVKWTNKVGAFHHKTELIFLMLDPFGYLSLRLALGRDLYQPNLEHHMCLERGGRFGAGRLNDGSNGSTKLAHFIIKLNWYFWCWNRLDICPFGLP